MIDTEIFLSYRAAIICPIKTKKMNMEKPTSLNTQLHDQNKRYT